MKKIKKIFIIVVIALFFSIIGKVNAEVDSEAIKQKLEVNSEMKGKKFTVGVMGNYYKNMFIKKNS